VNPREIAADAYPPTMWWIMGGIVLMLVLLVLWTISQFTKGTQSGSKTRLEYDEALAALRKDPGNRELRSTALLKGRAYSRLTTGPYGVQSFSEAAIRNDLDDIPIPSPLSDPSSRLQILANLRDTGQITDEEYQAQRTRILEEI